jgi:hypothetical protein
MFISSAHLTAVKFHTLPQGIFHSLSLLLTHNWNVCVWSFAMQIERNKFLIKDHWGYVSEFLFLKQINLTTMHHQQRDGKFNSSCPTEIDTHIDIESSESETLSIQNLN